MTDTATYIHAYIYRKLQAVTLIYITVRYKQLQLYNYIDGNIENISALQVTITTSVTV